MTLKKNESTDINFKDNEEGKVYLLLNGKVILRKHSADNPFDFKVLSVFKPGSFIGAKELDMSQSCLPNAWAIVASH